MGTNLAGSPFRSHIGQTGKGTVQNFSPREKNVVSTCISLDPHLPHCWGGGSAIRVSKSAFTRGGSSCVSDIPFTLRSTSKLKLSSIAQRTNIRALASAVRLGNDVEIPTNSVGDATTAFPSLSRTHPVAPLKADALPPAEEGCMGGSPSCSPPLTAFILPP